ncbi:hypothetical protein AB0B13_30425 [Streptomyces sp. NPDC042898]|uniref:hypothetical protein n=1 Tax=Streptomyces sp. NPDC042898 TaxID=3154334 RepID=UPI0033D9DED7
MRRRPTTATLAALTALATLTAAFATGCGSDDDKPDPLRGQQWGLDALKMPDAWWLAKLGLGNVDAAAAVKAAQSAQAAQNKG